MPDRRRNTRLGGEHQPMPRPLRHCPRLPAPAMRRPFHATNRSANVRFLSYSTRTSEDGEARDIPLLREHKRQPSCTMNHDLAVIKRPERVPSGAT